MAIWMKNISQLTFSNLKVYSNFMKYQLSEYVKSQGMALESLTTKELEDMESAMIADIYPG